MGCLSGNVVSVRTRRARIAREEDVHLAAGERAAAGDLLHAEVALDAKPADLVGAAVKDAQTRATVRVEAERLDTLLHMIGELVVRRSSVEQLAGETGDSRLLAAVGEGT